MAAEVEIYSDSICPGVFPAQHDIPTELCV